MATTVYPYTQYGGIWTASQQADAKAAGTWPVPPAPKLYSWGANNFGQLGLGNTTNYSSPKQIGSLTTWNSLGTNLGESSFVIKTDGTLWAWGYNDNGNLGLGNLTRYSSPKQVGALTNWYQVSGSDSWTLALKTDGTIWSWGYGGYGTLGLNNTTDYSSPKQIGALTNWAYVATGLTGHSVALKTDGTMWSWGRNNQGQLGLNLSIYSNTSSPQQIGSLTTWSRVAVGYANVLAIKTDGTLWTWGIGVYGGLGLGNETRYSSPKQVGSLTNWQKPSAGFLYSAAIKTDGTLWAWGYNANGMLGIGNIVNISSPQQVGSLTNWLNISCGFYHCAATKTDGTLWTWGYNLTGQLGLGNTTNRSSPVQVGALTSWLTTSAGKYATLGIAVTV